MAEVSTIKDLGVYHDSKLLFDKHINYIITKASKALGFIMRTSADLRQLKSIKILYCAYVRPILEYASQVWNPQYEVYKSRIEAVQKRFLRFLDFKARQFSDGYEHRCRRYHFLPLWLRREINDLTLLIAISKGEVDCPYLLERMIKVRVPNKQLRRCNLLHVKKPNTNYRQNAYTIRAPRLFNNSKFDIDLFGTSISRIKNLYSDDYFAPQT